MKKKVGVLLSGCGVMDGSEIHESVLTLLAIEKEGMEAVCIAPNKEQTQVINHLTNKPTDEKRNILIESARIARGNIKDIKEVSSKDIDALVLPGGFGAALNLSSFGKDGEKATVLPEVETLLNSVHNDKKPIGAICIAPNIIAKLFKGAEITIGNDKDTASKLETMGAKHVDKCVNEVVIDKERLIVSTPAYMLGKNLVEVEEGISNLVKEISNLLTKVAA